MGAHSFDSARSAAQISIHRYTTQCGERLRDSIPIVPLDRPIDRSLLVRVKERRDETRGPRCGGGTICRIVGCPVRALAPHHHRKRRRRRRGLGEEERARKKSVVNWDQDVTPRARGRIGTWSGSYTYPTGTGTGALCGSRTRARARAHTRAHGDPRYVSAAATGNNKRRAILINYLYR